MSKWFPLPETIADLQRLVGSDLGEETLFLMLTDTQAQEWREKVGVRGLQEGSGKTTARLLCVQGWVFKTDRVFAQNNLAVLQQRYLQLGQMAQALGIYHPRKHWFLLREGEFWLPITACPEMTTLRAITDLPSRLRGWLAMYRLGARLLRDHEIELDLNPANFAQEKGNSQLWYLDDEFYVQQKGLGAIGMSLAHRMAEADLPTVFWQELGAALKHMLSDLELSDYGSLRSLQDSLEEYPLRGNATQCRQYLLRGLLEKKNVVLSTGTMPRRTCIIADIHANLPALEAVLQAVQEIGVSDYLCLGDIVGYGPHPEACVARIADLPLMAAIKGNHDQAVVSGNEETGIRSMAQESFRWTLDKLSPESKKWLASLPNSWREQQVMAIHGSLLDPQHMYGYIYEMTYEDNLCKAQAMELAVVFFGHSHFPLVYRMCKHQREQRLPSQSVRLFEPECSVLINPGSVGQPRDRDPRAAFAIWEHASKQVHFFRQVYPVEQTMAALRKEGLNERLAQRLQEGY